MTRNTLTRSLVISFTGLTPAALSCFGSSWNRTPALDGLAADGVCWDRLICHDSDPIQVWADVWNGCSKDADQTPWILITDDRSILERADAIEGGQDVEIVFIEQVKTTVPACSMDETHLSNLVSEAMRRMEDSRANHSIWLHSQFLTQGWDAPRDLFPIDEDVHEEEVVEESWDEGDATFEDGSGDVESVSSCEPIFDQVDPPHHALNPSDHVDLPMAWMRTYGCQIRLIDHLMDDLIESAEQADMSMAVFGTSGFSLGQNGWIGHQDGPLRSCHLVVPMMFSRGGPLRIRNVLGTDQIGSLVSALSCRATAWPSVDEWTSWNEHSDGDDSHRRRVTTRSQNSDACVTTQDWFYVRDGQESEFLYLKPDDVNDVNDVSRLKPDVVEAFQKIRNPDPSQT